MDAVVDISGTVLETDRLVLRAWRPADLDDFYDYASDAAVGEMAGWPPHETPDTTKAVLAGFIAAKTEFAIVEKTGGRVIGSVGLHESWANQNASYRHLKVKDIGYALGREYWGRGLMPEAVKAVIRYSFGPCGLEALSCGHSLANKQSGRVIEKCGFTFVEQGEYFNQLLQKKYPSKRYILLNGQLAAAL